MPGPTHAPERPVRTLPGVPPPANRPMSLERQRRLRRTLAIGAGLLLILLWIAIKVLAGGGDPKSTAAAHVATTTKAPAASATTATSAKASTSGARSATSDPTSVPASGDGKLVAVAIPGADSDRTGRRVTFSVDVEGGLGVDPAAFAAKARSVLGDARGWESKLGVHFVALSPKERADGAVADIRITLASPHLTDQLCAPLQTEGKVSCNHNGRAVINAMRWTGGVEYYTDLADYRIYLINHEVGHGLWQVHENCPGTGQKAPIMQQQTLGLQGCTAWPWPQQNG